jgi:pentose-5-phosphate-3-epimerase
MIENARHVHELILQAQMQLVTLHFEAAPSWYRTA